MPTTQTDVIVAEAVNRLLLSLPEDSATAFYATDDTDSYHGALVITADGVLISVDWDGSMVSTTLNEYPWRSGVDGNLLRL